MPTMKITFAGFLIAFIAASADASSFIVISQVYGGGGNSGSTLRNDFVELFNRGTPVTLTGWSIQYASANGSTWDVTPLNISLSPGQYYLIALAAGTGGTVNLPSAQATGSTNLSATAGKIALVNSTVPLSGTCPPAETIVDFVGYGSANCAETASAPGLTNTTALMRGSNGCADTDLNLTDFSTAAPAPRTASTPRIDCGVVTLTGSNTNLVPQGASSTPGAFAPAPLIFSPTSLRAAVTKPCSRSIIFRHYPPS